MDHDIRNRPEGERDRAIIALYQERDEQALRETEAAYGRYCMGIALGIVGSRSDAEECVSDAYLRVWQTIPPKDPPSLKLYLGRIVRNMAISCYRKSHRFKRNAWMEISLSELEECMPMPEESSPHLRELLEQFLRSESILDRRLFIGRYWYGYPPQTLADAHGLTPNAVNLRLMRSRQRLKAFLEKEGYRI